MIGRILIWCHWKKSPNCQILILAKISTHAVVHYATQMLGVHTQFIPIVLPGILVVPTIRLYWLEHNGINPWPKIGFRVSVFINQFSFITLLVIIPILAAGKLVESLRASYMGVYVMVMKFVCVCVCVCCVCVCVCVCVRVCVRVCVCLTVQ